MSQASLTDRVSCHVLGHDWIYRRDEGERICDRCGTVDDYSADETHGDEGATKGQVRFRIEDGQLRIQRYSCTAHGPNSEEWGWFPIAAANATDANLIALRHQIDDHIDTSAMVHKDHLDPGLWVTFTDDDEQHLATIDSIGEESVLVTDRNSRQVRISIAQIEDVEPLGLTLDVTHPDHVGSVDAALSYPHEEIIHRIDVEESFGLELTEILDEMGYEIVPQTD